MGAQPQLGGQSAGRVIASSAVSCGFPACDGNRVTAAGMCQEHRRVVISTTGSWLEAS